MMTVGLQNSFQILLVIYHDIKNFQITEPVIFWSSRRNISEVEVNSLFQIAFVVLVYFQHMQQIDALT